MQFKKILRKFIAFKIIKALSSNSIKLLTHANLQKLKPSKLIKSIFVISLLLNCTVSLAAEFKASIVDEQVNTKQAFSLKLALRDAIALQDPDLTALKKAFIVRGIHQFSNFYLYNGKQSQESGWQLTVLAKDSNVKRLVIPAITIETDHGHLATEELVVNIDTDNLLSTDSELPVAVEMALDKPVAYINETLALKLKVISYAKLVNVELDKLELNDVILETIGNPKQYSTLINSKKANIIEIHYLLTPLKVGELLVPKVVLHGEFALKSRGNSAHWDPLTDLSLFDNLRGNNYRPFAIASNAIKLNVMPPQITHEPWLPLQALNISESWDNLNPGYKVTAGQPITRTISLNALGMRGQQLPDLQAAMEVSGLKVYADKPVITNKIDPQTGLYSTTKEITYSLVAGQTGELLVPAINLPWWNLTTEKAEVVKLPAINLQVEPAVSPKLQTNSEVTASATIANVPTTSNPANEVTAAQPTAVQAVLNFFNTSSTQKNLYYLIAILIFLLLIMLFFVWRFNKQLVILKNNKATNKVTNTDNYPADKCSTTANNPDSLAGLHAEIINHAKEKWHTPVSISLKAIPDYLEEKGYCVDKELADKVFTPLDKALYAKVDQLDVTGLRKNWQSFKRCVIVAKNKNEQDKSEFDNLNPT